MMDKQRVNLELTPCHHCTDDASKNMSFVTLMVALNKLVKLAK